MSPTKIPPVVLVSEIMVATPHTISPDMSLQDVVDLLIRHQISGAPVVDGMGRLITVIGEGDTLRLAAREGLEAKVSDCLRQLPPTKKLIVLQPHNTFAEAYHIFLKDKIHRIPVVDSNGRLKGLVSRSNILKLFVEAHYGKKIQRAAN
jgi:CBS domain-containing protein